jgi:hypothetical protein
MADIVLTTDELLVLSGPSSINLEVDFGPEGERGSLFYVSVGNPNTALVGQTPKAKDLCINVLKTDNEYSYVYQYNAAPDNEDGNPSFQWYPIIKLSPLQYNKIMTGTFVDGSKVFNIPVSYIVDEETSQTLTSANFNITYSIPNENPISSSIQIGSFTNDPGTGLQVIPVTVNAIEYASSTWQNLTGTKTVHFVISIVV